MDTQANSIGAPRDWTRGARAMKKEQASVFVFGSNLAGRHGAGSALEAIRYHGATYGQGEGRQGQSYAIPTKGARLQTLPLADVAQAVSRFINYAIAHPDEMFQVVRIGCGLAGFKDTDIAPMFTDAPANVQLPEGWR